MWNIEYLGRIGHLVIVILLFGVVMWALIFGDKEIPQDDDKDSF